MCNALPTSDPIRKRLYTFPRMVADLLRSLFADEDLGADYGTLEKLPAEYVSDAFQQRRALTGTARPNGRVGSLLRQLRSTTTIGVAGSTCW